MRIIAPLIAAFSLAACVSTTEQPPTRFVSAVGPLPAMKSFAATRPRPPGRSNATIALDFLDLTFRMESGRQLPFLTRFEAPIRVGLRGAVPGTAQTDLNRLIARLRNEAGIDIARARQGERANVNVEFISRATLQRAVPLAACFVVPVDQSFSQFRRTRRSGGSSWANLTTREAVTVFIPADVSPQEIRDCLHEEIAQSLGPINDLYRLPDSVFNDDNFQTVLTGFDMLVLRITYSPELRSGMTEAQVAARLPSLLARYNPRGQRAGSRPSAENRAWTQAIETALSPRTSPSGRQIAATRALAIARGAGWQDVRLAFSHFTMGRVTQPAASQVSAAAYTEAARLYARPGTEVQQAHAGMQLAAFALSQGRAEDALSLVARHAPVAQRSENAALLATLLLIKAESLEMLGRRDQAHRVRNDALGWARYGFGSDAHVLLRAAEIAALRTRNARAEQ